jgi:hypothetical protein
MILNGGCHCGAITFALDWPGSAADIVARECDCSFCVKHGGAWTSDPDAKLRVTLHQPGAVSRYAFGTGTAIFHVCARCGAVPFVSSEIDARLHAVVNVNTLTTVDPSSLRREAAHFDAETPQRRLARRQARWIADVRITAAAG